MKLLGTSFWPRGHQEKIAEILRTLWTQEVWEPLKPVVQEVKNNRIKLKSWQKGIIQIEEKLQRQRVFLLKKEQRSQ